MHHKAESALKALIVVLLAFHAFTFSLFSCRLLLYPYDWEPSESDHIVYATRLLDGETLYKDDDSFPLLCMNYPPGYHLLLAAPVKLFGPHMYAGRLLMLTVAAALCLLIYKVVADGTGWKFLGLVMAVAALAYGPVSVWLALVRVDGAYVVLALAATYLLSRHQKGYTLIVPAALLLAYSFFTKQQGLFALGAGALYLLVSRKYRECAALVAFFAVFTIPLNLGLDYLTDGWYNRHLFGSHLYRELFWHEHRLLVPFLAASSLLVALSCYEIACQLNSRKLSVWTCYLLGTLPVAFLIFYDGTAENYLLPLFSGLLILAGFGLKRMNAGLHQKKKKARTSWVYLLIVLQLLIFCGSHLFLRGPMREDRVGLDQLAKHIRDSTEPVLVDRMNSLILGTKHEAYFIQPVLLRFLYQGHKWNPDVVVTAVSERRFSLICMFDRSQFVHPIQKAIRENYVPVSSIPVNTFRPGFECQLIVFERKEN